MVFFIYYL